MTLEMSRQSRTGIIATNPAEGFAFNDELKNLYDFSDQLDGFLIDANVYPGSSGSLVMLKQQLSTINARGEIEFGGFKRRPYLLGIVSASIPLNDTTLGSRQRIGLGVVHSASVVRETIDQLSNTGIAVPTRGVVRKLSLDDNAPGEMKLFEPVSGHYLSWTVGASPPSGTCVPGSVYSRSKGGTGSTLYICENSIWVGK